MAARYRRDVNHAAVWVVLEISVRADGEEAACRSHTCSGAILERADYQLLKQTTKDLKRLKLEFYAEELYEVTLKAAPTCYWQDKLSCQCSAHPRCQYVAEDESPRLSRSDAT